MIVATGLVPVAPLKKARCLPKRDGRDNKPGHDKKKRRTDSIVYVRCRIYFITPFTSASTCGSMRATTIA